MTPYSKFQDNRYHAHKGTQYVNHLKSELRAVFLLFTYLYLVELFRNKRCNFFIPLNNKAQRWKLACSVAHDGVYVTIKLFLQMHGLKSCKRAPYPKIQLLSSFDCL